MRCTTLRNVAAVAVTVFGIAACTDNSTPESTSPNGEQKLVVTLSVHADTVPESFTRTIVARVTDQVGMLKSVPVEWKSTNTAVASVLGGTITGVSTGTALIVASAGTGADTAVVFVSPKEYLLDVQPSAAIVAVGDTIGFQAIVRTKSGDLVSVTNLSWSSSDTVAARFVNGSSLVGTSEGEVSVSAETVYGRGTGNVRVFRTPVASVTISPSTANVYAGAKVELAVTLRDQQGRLAEGTVTFGSSDYSKATVNQDGIVTGLSAGTVVITATSGSKTGSATVNVLSNPASSVSLVLPSDTIPAGVEVQATATPLDASGNPITGKSIAYQSSNPSVATITSAGVIKGVAEGSTTISAIVDAKIASKRLSVGGRRATSMTISPSSPSVSVGKNSQLTAKVLDQMGNEMVGQPITWSSANASIAQVSSGGLVTAVSAGSTSISASSNNLAATVTLTVASAPVASVQVSPASPSVTVGGSVTLSASAYDADGNALPGRAAAWASQNPTVASVNSLGVVTAVGAGSTTVTATIEGKSSSATISVGSAPAAPVTSVTVTLANPTLSVGQETQATAILKDAQGNVLTRAITWTSLDTAVAKVNSSGMVTAFAGGTVAITARSENVTGSASLTVNTPSPAAVAQVIFDVPTQDITVGQTVQSVITLKDAQGNTLLGRTITYSTSNSSIVTVSATGAIKGVGVGTARITATSGGVSAGEGFTVTQGAQTLASIAVTPPSASLSIGQTSQATAVGKDAQGNVSSGTTFTWISSNASAASVSSSGLVTAVGPGSAIISAVSAGVTGSMSVSVTSVPASVASVTVSAPPSLQVGTSAPATAVARDAAGNVLSGKTFVWTSAAASVASVSSSGVVTGLAAGTAQIRATVDGSVGSATVTVATAVTSVALPELPRVTPPSQDPYPGRACSVTLPAGGNITSALSAARGGSVVCLTAGATYSPITLPARAAGDTGWIVLRTATTLPPEGTRMRPSQAGSLAKILVNQGGLPALETAPGTYGYVLRGIEIAPTTSVSLTYTLVALGTNGPSQDTMGEVPQRIILSQMYIHGTTNGEMQRCVALNSGATAIVDSWLSDCHGKGYDSQAIGGWNGPGPHLVRNNHLEGAGENVMWGGATPSIPNLVAADITFQRNYVYTPIAWKGVWTKKNLFETKNAVRVLVEDNVFDGSWTDAQIGPAIVLKSINDQGTCNWCRTTDVTIRRSYVTHAGGGIVISGQENYNSFGTVDSVARRILIQDVVFDSLNMGPYTGGARALQMTSGPTDITFDRTITTGIVVCAMLLDNHRPALRTLFRSSAWVHGTYFSASDGTAPGVATLTVAVPGYIWESMTVVRGQTLDPLPTGTTVLTSEPSWAAQIRSTVSTSVAGVIVQP